jgi:hypothetical protein
MANVVPTLSSNGWVTESSRKIDFLISYYSIADYSQSSFFLGQVKSLPYLLQLHQNDMVSLRDAIENDLLTLLNAYYDGADVLVDIAPISSDDETNHEIRITGRVLSGKKTEDIGYLIGLSNNKIRGVTSFEHRW